MATMYHDCLPSLIEKSRRMGFMRPCRLHMLNPLQLVMTEASFHQLELHALAR